MSVSIWLLPDSETAEPLDAAMAEQALACAKSPFRAHLTLASADGARHPDLAPLTRFAPISLARAGILATEDFTRSFALRFESGPQLRALAEAARELVGAEADDPNFEPHVSLVYGYVDDRRRPALEALAARHVAPMRFNRVCATVHNGAISSHSQVAAWKVGPAYPLLG